MLNIQFKEEKKIHIGKNRTYLQMLEAYYPIKMMKKFKIRNYILKKKTKYLPIIKQ